MELISLEKIEHIGEAYVCKPLEGPIAYPVPGFRFRAVPYAIWIGFPIEGVYAYVRGVSFLIIIAPGLFASIIL